MNFRDILQTASSNMLRSKVRTLLTIIAIVIGAMTITLTNGIGTGIKTYLNQQIGNLGASNILLVTLTTKAASPTNGPVKYAYNPNVTVSSGGLGKEQLLMNLEDIAKIKSIHNITSVVPAHSLSPDYIQGTGSKYQLTLEQQFGNATSDMVVGSGVNNNSTQNQISIPESYVSVLGYSSNKSIIGKTVTIGVTNPRNIHFNVIATVTGVQQKNLIGESTSFANTTLANNIYHIRTTGIPKTLTNTFLTAYATFPKNLTTNQINKIKSQLTAKGFTGMTIKDEESTLFSVISAIIIVFDIFGIIALLAASFGIINTLFMSVQERTKEIGLMKALGMSPHRIFALFSIEAILIGFWGSLLGVVFAFLIGSSVNAIGKHSFLKAFPGLSLLTFPLNTIVSVIVGIMIIAFLAGALPALRASRKDPIEALRYE